MNIFSRTRDIIAANVNDMLDRAEDPSKTIRLIINEMNETLMEVRASAARAIADQKELRRAADKLSAAQSNWAEKAELAMSKGREDLAKAALIEKAKMGQFAQATAQEVSGIEQSLKGYEGDIAKLESKLREARSRQGSLITRLETAENRGRLRRMTSGPKIDDAFARFELLERHVDIAEGHVEAHELGRTRSLEDEISELRTNEAVDAEFAALKQRMSAKAAA
jgi:phage shock protein A